MCSKTAHGRCLLTSLPFNFISKGVSPLDLVVLRLQCSPKQTGSMHVHYLKGLFRFFSTMKLVFVLFINGNCFNKFHPVLSSLAEFTDG